MNLPRTIIVPTLDHGPVTIAEPAWCLGHRREAGHRIDITHTAATIPLAVPTHRGSVALLRTCLESRPFANDPFLRRTFVNVELAGDWHPSGPADLKRMADTLAARAQQLRQLAQQLAALRGGEAR